MPGVKSHRVAIVWRGDHEARRAATPQNNRFYRIFEELAAPNGKRRGSGIVTHIDSQYIDCGVEAGTPLDARPSSAPLAKRGVRTARTGPAQPSFSLLDLATRPARNSAVDRRARRAAPRPARFARRRYARHEIL